MDGKGNGDTLTGAGGDDTYLADRPEDRAVELVGGGTDTVRSTSANYVLGDHVENLQLVGTTAQSGMGNALGNRLTSNDAGSSLSGGGGADILVAGRGADVLTGGTGKDIFDFDRIPTRAGRVTDFTLGEDMLDLRGLFTAAGYKGSNPLTDRLLEFRADGNGGTGVYFDADGSGSASSWSLITVVEKVAPGSLTIQNDWFFV